MTRREQIAFYGGVMAGVVVTLFVQFMWGLV